MVLLIQASGSSSLQHVFLTLMVASRNWDWPSFKNFVHVSYFLCQNELISVTCIIVQFEPIVLSLLVLFVLQTISTCIQKSCILR